MFVQSLHLVRMSYPPGYFPVGPHCSTRDPRGRVRSRSKGWRWV